MNTYKRLLVAGSIAYDEIMDFPDEFQQYFHPERLHQINVSFVVNRLQKQFGGIATNVAYTYSLLNSTTPVAILGAVGKDGHEFLEFYKKNNIDTQFIVEDKDLYTSTGKVITDKKNNQIWGFYYGASASASRISFGKFSAEDILLLAATHTDAFLHCQKEAIKRKIPYMYDPGMALTWIHKDDLKEGILHSTYLIGNDYEIAQMSKFLSLTVQELCERGIIVITTLGADGVRYQTKSKTVTVTGYKGAKVVDPTGAGDAFRGGFLGALLQGKSVEDCLKYGNIMASFAVEHYGTVNHHPRKEEIEQRFLEIID